MMKKGGVCMYNDPVYFIIWMMLGIGIIYLCIDIAWRISNYERRTKMTKEKKMSPTVRYEYWQIADDLGYSLQCKDRIMHAETESDAQQILTTERKRVD